MRRTAITGAANSTCASRSQTSRVRCSSSRVGAPGAIIGRRDRVTPALVPQREARDVQLFRGEPTGQLQDESPRDEQQCLRVLDTIHQFDARVEGRWHLQPLVGGRRHAGDLIEPVEQLRAATLLEAGTR